MTSLPMTAETSGVADLFHPALSSHALDMLGGVGEYTLPQRSAGMALGALVGNYLGGSDHRDTGTALGAGAGYLGAAGLDKAIGSYRRGIVNDVINNSLANGTITNTTPDDLVDLYSYYGKNRGWLRGPDMETLEKLSKFYSSPGFTFGGNGELSGRVINNYNYMYDFKNNPQKIEDFMSRLKADGVTQKAQNIIRGNINNFLPEYNLHPDKVTYPILSHELLERKDVFHNNNRYPAQFIGEFQGPALDAYGPGVAMNHNSTQVLGDETNTVLRTMNEDEANYLRGLRNASNEGPTLSAIRNTGSVYDVTLKPSEIDPWAKTTSDAIRRGLDTGELLTDAEKAGIDPGLFRRYSGRAGRALRQAENAVVSPIASALDATAGRGYRSLSKYISKFL